MTVPDLLRKLAPLIPGQAETWKRSLSLVDSETRGVLEKQITATAHDLLGDFETKILLPPPPKKKAGGKITLGTVVYDKDLHPFGISPGELLQGLGIYGRSGAGKTNVVFKLVQELDRLRIPFLFLDWKRTARHLLPSLGSVNFYTPGRDLSPLDFNPLIPPPGLELRVHILGLVDILASAYTLGDGAKNLLQRVLQQAYESANPWPTLSQVLASLEKKETPGRAAGWKASAVRALQSLMLSDPLDGGNTRQEDLVKRLSSESTVIELDGLADNAKKFLIPTLMTWLFQSRLATPDREKLKLVIIVEEAHHLLFRQESRAEESVMNKMLRQCRELGIGMIVVDQHPHLVSSAALGNTFASICLNLKEPGDINRAAALSQLQADEKRYLSTLPVGQGIVKLQDRWHSPFLVCFSHTKIEKGKVTDRVFQRAMTRNTSRSEGTVRLPASPRQIRRVRPGDEPVSRNGLRLLLDCAAHPIDGVRIRYLRLGLSMDKGTKAKSELLNAGLVDAQEIPVGRTRRLILRPTGNAKKMLRLGSGSSIESLEHEFWKHFWAQKMRDQGYSVQLEAPRVGGRVDVLARKRVERLDTNMWNQRRGEGAGREGEERVGIEIETGKSDAVRNVANCLRSRFNRVVVVATSRKAKKKVERELAKNGLLVSGRVQARLRGLGEG